MRVDYNAGVHGIRLDRPYLDLIRNILHHLRDHLASAGGIGFDIGELGIPNGILALSVMIQHHNGLCGIQKPRTLDHGRTVCIHDHKDGAFIE